jgi:uncharacterized protein YqeY
MPDALKDQLAADLKDAMRAKDKVRLRTIRSLRAALMEAEIAEREGGEATLTEQQELQVVRKQAKQRKDAIEQYEDAGRDDLAGKEHEELVVIQEYLPKPMTEEELRAEMEAIVEATGASGMKDMGKVMGRAMSQLRGKVDGSRVQQVAQELLKG